LISINIPAKAGSKIFIQLEAPFEKNILVIDGHPDPEQSRFYHVLAATYVDAARSAGTA
jgi:hypothetical protein